MQGKSQILRAETPSTSDLAVIDRRIESTYRQVQVLYRAAKAWTAWKACMYASECVTEAESKELLEDLREAVKSYERAAGIAEIGTAPGRKGAQP